MWNGKCSLAKGFVTKQPLLFVIFSRVEKNTPQKRSQRFLNAGGLAATFEFRIGGVGLSSNDRQNGQTLDIGIVLVLSVNLHFFSLRAFNFLDWLGQ